VRGNGEVIFHEGYVMATGARRIEARRRSVLAKAPRPEVTGPMHAYIDLHRHAACARRCRSWRAALRLMVAAHRRFLALAVNIEKQATPQ
jgi:ParB family chromosome partitioning protein